MYKVRSKMSDYVYLETESLSEAMERASANGSWNLPCDVIAESGEVVYSSEAWRDVFRPGLPKTLGFVLTDGQLQFVTEMPSQC